MLNIKARWSGHQVFSEVFIKVELNLSLLESHNIIEEIENEITHHSKFVSIVIVDVEPEHFHDK